MKIRQAIFVLLPVSVTACVTPYEAPDENEVTVVNEVVVNGDRPRLTLAPPMSSHPPALDGFLDYDPNDPAHHSVVTGALSAYLTFLPYEMRRRICRLPEDSRPAVASLVTKECRPSRAARQQASTMFGAILFDRHLVLLPSISLNPGLGEVAFSRRVADCRSQIEMFEQTSSGWKHKEGITHQGYRWSAPVPTEDIDPSIVEVEVRRDGEFFWLGQFTVFPNAGQYFRTSQTPPEFEGCFISVGHYTPPGTRAQNDFQFSVQAHTEQGRELHFVGFSWSELKPRSSGVLELGLCEPEEQSLRAISANLSLELPPGKTTEIDLPDGFTATLRRHCPQREQICVIAPVAQPITVVPRAPVANWRTYDILFARDSGEEIWRGALHVRDDGAGTSVTEGVSRRILFPCRRGLRKRPLLTDYNSHLNIWVGGREPSIKLAFSENWADANTGEQSACLPFAGEDNPRIDIDAPFDPDGETVINGDGITLIVSMREK